MPAYNAAKYIEATIKSIQAQTYVDWELLVISDGSTDETVMIVKNMMASDARIKPEGPEHYYCVYASRKDGHIYQHTHEEIMARYGENMVMQEEMPQMNWPQMGRYMYTAKLKTFEEAEAFINWVQG